MTTSHHRDDKMSLLYEASYRGSISTLNSLIQQDPLILYKISQTAFIETPLHISVLLGHLDFTKALLTHKPQLSLELDSSRSTALHLASAEGHNDIVKELLQAHEQACLVHDQEGRIPLHYAAMRGRMEIMRELIRAKPESLRILDNGKTIFHLCVTYNHLESLKALAELEPDTSELLNFRDFDGNTILHLAIMLKQVETVRYLLSISKISEAASLEGFTVHNILERSPKDLKSLEMQVILMKASIKNEKNQIETHPHPPPSTTTDVLDQATKPPKKKGWRKILKSMENQFKHKGDWIEETRGNLSLMSTMISTITFQAAMNPPGGVIQQGIYSSSNTIQSGGPLVCLDYPKACPGEPMLAIKDPSDFLQYLVFNTMSFMASLSVTLLLVSGIPLKHKAIMWMLSIGMCITLSFLALTYLYGVFMLTSRPTLLDSNLVTLSLMSWIGLVGLVGVLIKMRFLFWLGKKCIKKIKHRKMSIHPRNENGSSLI